MVNLFVLGFVIIVVDSDIQVFRVVTQGPVFDSIIEIFTKEPYMAWAVHEDGTSLNASFLGWFKVLNRICGLMVTIMIQKTDVFMNLLLFAMSSVTVTPFFYDDAVTSLFNACNQVEGLENYDTYVYYYAVYTLRLLLIPLIYVISEILVPGLPSFIKENKNQALDQKDKERVFGLTAILKNFSYFSPDLWWLYLSGNYVSYAPNEIPFSTNRASASLKAKQHEIKHLKENMYHKKENNREARTIAVARKMKKDIRHSHRGGNHRQKFLDVLRKPSRPTFRVVIDDQLETVSFLKCSGVINSVSDWEILTSESYGGGFK